MDYETVVIGAGVVGLAVAAELARDGPLLLIERNAQFGQETSSHNSEVLHAGLYYPTGSLKARLCVEGNQLLRDLSEQQGPPIKMLGKLVVGSEVDMEALENLLEQAHHNGVQGPRLLSRAEVGALEPNVRAAAALWSPTTGILDSHGLMRCFLMSAEAAGADVVFGTRLEGLASLTHGFCLSTVDRDGSVFDVTAERVVNAAGLEADHVAEMLGIDVDEAGYRLHWCKGDYCSTRPRCWSWVSHLIYPAPTRHGAGLGIHLTLDLEGRLRIGPDATYLEPGEEICYRVGSEKRILFAKRVQQYLPGIQPEDLAPEMAGIRPKLQGPGEAPRDFVIQEETARGFPGLVNLIGIESPGLTASPAIAREVRRILQR